MHTPSDLKAVLGPTNTGKTHLAVERLCAHSSGIIGFPLRLLAREVYDRVVAIKGPKEVGLITGEERIMPPGARWLLCTAESMPLERDVAFLALDEAQLGADRDRGHIFTDRLLNARGREETMILGSESLKPLVRSLLPDAEIITRPRFSRLSYAGPKKLSRLPPRTAIIAFSADDVYAIAELMRRYCGGAAIVMGNLSPRTRNAQVEMYQSGEVDYIVATDAIGMGLNMDISHVAFAGLGKFDGQRRRRLTISEMAQIAGRAGRHQRDGTFGAALSPGENPEFAQEEIDRIEEHRFPPLASLFWRNNDLDYASPADLLTSLDVHPPRVELRQSPMAEDHAVLRNLANDSNIAPLVHGVAGTKRLWEACGLPDFRNTGPEFHARLVARLFTHLANGPLPDQMIADDVARLDTVQGNIASLSSRLSAIRTWTYVAHRADWLRDPDHWAAQTRAVEEKLSDALHDQLTERFVDRKASKMLRERGKAGRPSDLAIADDGTASIFGETVGRVQGFHFAADAMVRTGDKKKFLAAAENLLPHEWQKRALSVEAAADMALELRLEPGEVPAIKWSGGTLAILVRGRGLLTPDFKLDPSVARLDPVLRDKVRIRLQRFVRDMIDRTLAPLVRLNEVAFAPTTPPALRAVLAPLAESAGTLPRTALAEGLASLGPEDRKTIRHLGVTFGSLTLFHPGLLKPAAMRLRLALCAVRAGHSMSPVPMPGLSLLDQPSAELAAAAVVAGYFPFDQQMLRIDLLERIALKIHDQRSGHLAFVPDAKLAASIGVGSATFDRVLRALGFVPVQTDTPGQWKWRGLRQAQPIIRNQQPRRRKRKAA